MRRTPLVRRTPLARGNSELKRTPLAPVSAKQKARNKAWSEVGEELDRQGRFACEARVSEQCSERREHKHHIVPRGRGGRDVLSNCLPCCHHCHDWIHHNSAEASRLGLLRREEPNQ